MRQIRRLLFYMRRASPSRSIPRQIIDLMLHRLLVNLRPTDYYYYEFYKLKKTWKQKSRYVSVRGSRYWIFGNNPFKYQVLFTDKYVQKAILGGLKLPTPEPLGLICTNGAISSLQEFASCIKRAPEEFVLKPVNASGGRGFRRLRKSENVLLEFGAVVQLDDLWHSLQPDMKRGILIEATAHNSEVIRRMNPSSLNTFRVVTFQFPDAGWSPICSYLKVGRENQVADNSHSGGMLVRIDANGQTGSAQDLETRAEFTHHPDSGVALSGVQIDGFQDVVKLAVSASLCFSQMSILGWDIGLTPSGPTIIEVNAAPGLDVPQLAYGGIITDELARVFTPKHIFSRYRKTHMYPNHLRDRKGRI